VGESHVKSQENKNERQPGERREKQTKKKCEVNNKEREEKQNAPISS
jgi:hypothetical protein